ncbi:MAG: alanine racemase [Acidobacteriota bacterium]
MIPVPQQTGCEKWGQEEEKVRIEELDTPALIIDLDVMERNLQRMAEYCRRHNLKLRPHTKTHKTPELARRQLEGGAIGITVAKIGEAEVMVGAGLNDILLAYPVIGASKSNRLAALLERARVSVSLDSREAAGWVSQACQGHTVGVLVEVDLGMRRCGLPVGSAATRLARFIDSQPGLRFQGLMFYSGHVHPNYDGNTVTLERLKSQLSRQRELFEKEKIEVAEISGGSTPSAAYSHQLASLTEIRPGTYIFNDRNTIEWGVCRAQDCAASIVTTVVSRAVEGRAIIDGGSKTFSSDGLMAGKRGGFGLVTDYPGVEFTQMNEEHGYLEVPPGAPIRVGRRLRVIPNHICAAVNMHEVLFGCRGDEVVVEWPVAARGKIR